MNRVIKAHGPDPRKEGNDGTSYLFMSCIGPVWKVDVDEVDERRPRCGDRRNRSGWEILQLQPPVASSLGTLDRFTEVETRLEIQDDVLLTHQASQRQKRVKRLGQQTSVKRTRELSISKPRAHLCMVLIGERVWNQPSTSRPAEGCG